jgi:glutamyl-tRNA reductase
VIVANRSYDKAAAIAQYLGGRAIHFDEFKRELHLVDIIISSTAAPHVILRKEEVGASMKKRRRPLLIIDMAVPRDVEPETGTIQDVTLYCLEDFNQIIEENLGRKRREAHKAESLIRQALSKIDLNELACS